MSRKELAGSLSTTQKALGYIVLFPSYLFYFPRIVIALFFVIFTSTNTSNVDLAVYLNFGVSILSILLAFLCLKKFLLDNIKEYLQDLKENTLWASIIGFPLTFGLSIVSSYIVASLLLLTGQEVAESNNQQAVQQLIQQAPVFMAINAVIIAPILEETLYRGLLFRTFYNRSRYFAYFFSAFLFGFSHIISGLLEGDWTQMIQIIPYVVMGLLVSFAYEKKGNICVPIIIHMLNNLVATLIICIPRFL